MEKEKFNYPAFLKQVASIAVPCALQNLFTTTGSMIDTMMIAPLGEATIGALGLCAQFASLFFSCYWGYTGAGMLFFGQYWGAKDEKGICRAYGTTLICVMAVSLIFFLGGFFFPNTIMNLYTNNPEVAAAGTRYLRLVCFAYPFQSLCLCMSALLRSTERVKIPFFSGGAAIIVNIFLNWVFIYGNLGAPRMGVRGAALATVISAIVNVFMIMLLAKKIRFKYMFMFREHFRLTKVWIAQYAKKCYPIIINELFIGFGFTICNFVLGRQSVEAIAALAVFRTLEGFVIAFFTGFANSAAIIIGKAVGSGNIYEAVRKSKRIVYLCGCTIMVVCLALLGIHPPVLHKMGLSGESFKLAKMFLSIYVIAAVIRMCNWTQNEVFRAGGDSAFGTVMEIAFMYIMVVPCVYLCGMVWHLPIAVVFIACYIDEPVRFAAMQIRLYHHKWIKPVTDIGRKALYEYMSG